MSIHLDESRYQSVRDFFRNIQLSGLDEDTTVYLDTPFKVEKMFPIYYQKVLNLVLHWYVLNALISCCEEWILG